MIYYLGVLKDRYSCDVIEQPKDLYSNPNYVISCDGGPWRKINGMRILHKANIIHLGIFRSL